MLVSGSGAAPGSLQWPHSAYSQQQLRSSLILSHKTVQLYVAQSYSPEIWICIFFFRYVRDIFRRSFNQTGKDILKFEVFDRNGQAPGQQKPQPQVVLLASQKTSMSNSPSSFTPRSLSNSPLSILSHYRYGTVAPSPCRPPLATQKYWCQIESLGVKIKALHICILIKHVFQQLFCTQWIILTDIDVYDWSLTLSITSPFQPNIKTYRSVLKRFLSCWKCICASVERSANIKDRFSLSSNYFWNPVLHISGITGFLAEITSVK